MEENPPAAPPSIPPENPLVRELSTTAMPQVDGHGYEQELTRLHPNYVSALRI